MKAQIIEKLYGITFYMILFIKNMLLDIFDLSRTSRVRMQTHSNICRCWDVLHQEM